MADQAVSAVVTGRVQGVSYRASLQREARLLGLTGWVRNCDDGSVEFMAQGEVVALQELLSWARTGPSYAHVARVATREVPIDVAIRTFEVRY